MVRRARCWAVTFAMLTGAAACVGTASRQGPPSQPRPGSVVSASAPAAVESGTAGPPLQSAPVPSAVSAAKSPWALNLPSSTLAPAPVQDLSQYTRWRQKRVIAVGKSHLQISRLAPDDRHVLVMSTMEFAVRIYDLSTGQLRWRHQLEGYKTLDRVDAVFWPDMREGLRFVLAGKDGVTLRDAVTGAVLERFWDQPTWTAGWSLDRRVLVAKQSSIPAQRSQLVFMVRDAERLRVHARLETSHRVDGWALSGDNRRFVTIGYPNDQVELRDLDSGEVAWSVPAPRYAGGVAISPDGAWVAAGGDHLLLIDATDPDRRSEYRDFGNNINTVVFSRASDVVMVSSYDGRIRILRNDVRTATLTLIHELRHGGTANVYDLSLLSDGSGVVSASGDRTVRWWGL